MKTTLKMWNDIYVQTFQHTRLLTQIVCFSLATMLVINSVELVINVSQLEDIAPELWKSVIEGIILGFSTALLFGSRFLLLFSKRKIYFWLSQFVWILSIAFLQLQITLIENSGCTKNMFPMFGEALSYLLVAYLLLSPVRQVLTALCTIVEIVKNKCLTQF